MEPSAAEADGPPEATTTDVAPQEKPPLSSPLDPGAGQTPSWEEEEPELLGQGDPSHANALPSPAGKEGASLQPPQKALFLKITLVRRRTGLPDPQLQEYLQGRLRLLENDGQRAVAVFSELSARLLSIHSEDRLIAITFWTLEEIWKFITYFSLGKATHQKIWYFGGCWCSEN